MNFDSLGLAEPIVRAVREQGYTQPTPIQAQAIPAVLQGGDLMAGAQTGTGKTAGFTLPMLHRLAAAGPKRDARGRVMIRALILTPTRELAAQVEESVRNYGKYLPLTSMVMFGGVGMQPQIDKLRRGVGIRFKGAVRTNVEEYCISESWVKVQAGKTMDRKGQPLLLKLNGPVEAWYEDLGENPPVAKAD